MSKAIINVENNEKGFQITVKRNENAVVYPEIEITRNHAKNETTYRIYMSPDLIYEGTEFDSLAHKVEDGIARDFLQIGKLVHEQKVLEYQEDINRLVDEILSM